MSGKRPSLAESMRAVAEAPPEAPPPSPKPRMAEPAAKHEKPDEGETRPKGFFAATRAGKKKATATLSSAAHRQLKTLAVEQEGGTVEGLLTEAINDLFTKYGKPPIA
jgi:hypothetical protein